MKNLRSRLRKYLHRACDDLYLQALSELTESKAIYNYQVQTLEAKIKELTILCRDQADRIRAQNEEIDRIQAEEVAAKTLAREFTIEIHNKEGVKRIVGDESKERKKKK